MALLRCVVACSLLLLGPRLAGAAVVYSADNLPGMGTCTNGNISWFMDPTYGRVIRVHVTDQVGRNSERCEFVAPNNGRKPGETYYIGWRSRVDAPLTGGWNGIYQMKCHGDHVADQPIVLTMRDNKLVMNNHEDIDGRETPRLVWQTDLPVNRWFTIVIKVHYSESRTEGYVQVWYNGQLQTLANGTTIHHGQTWDGAENNMHWGIYRADEVMGEGDHYLWRPRVATTFAEADPDGKSEPAAPDGGAAPADAAAPDGAVVDARVTPDAMAGTGGMVGTGGRAGTGGSAGTGGRGTGGVGGAGGAEEEPEPESPVSSGARASSGCSHGGPGGGAGIGAVMLLALLLTLRARPPRR